MNKKLLMLLPMLICSSAVYAQVDFVPGYFITKDGQRTDCQVLIRNSDWRDNPKSFDYRASAGSEPQAANLESVVELGLASGEVFLRLRVNIDRSPDEVRAVEGSRSPEFASEALFLRLILKGKATLYQYNEGNLRRFFYSIDDGPVNQLVYKKFMTPNTRVNRLDPSYNTLQLAVNEDYKQQLLNELKCESIERSDCERLTYELKPLSAIFTKYNKCSGGEIVNYEESKHKSWPMYLGVRVGLGMNSVNIKNIGVGGGGTANIESVANVRFGLELEGTMPFGKGNWALPIEVAYQSFSGQISSGSVKIDYASFDVLVGLRRYFPMSNGGSVYLTGSYLFGLPRSGSIQIVTVTTGIQSNSAIALAAGYRVGRFSGEFLYLTPRRLWSDNTYDAVMPSFAINAGYRLTK